MESLELFNRWTEVRNGLLAALDKINDEQINFTPRTGLWSLRETVVHIAGTEEGWLRCYTANQWHENPPQAVDYPTIESLKALLAKEHAVTESQFSKAIDATLEQICSLPWGSKCTMDWAVWHVLEHEIHHRGEIFLMLGLMGIEAPDV
jgi:uncharacterized damage-inducible protein DinB